MLNHNVTTSELVYFLPDLRNGRAALPQNRSNRTRLMNWSKHKKNIRKHHNIPRSEKIHKWTKNKGSNIYWSGKMAKMASMGDFQDQNHSRTKKTQKKHKGKSQPSPSVTVWLCPVCITPCLPVLSHWSQQFLFLVPSCSFSQNHV